MPGAVRLGDMCTGHGEFPPRPNIVASDNVIINARGAHRVGDDWAVHCGSSSCHGGKQAEGSPNVIVNGQPLARIGDSVDCGSRCAEGSDNVIING